MFWRRFAGARLSAFVGGVVSYVSQELFTESSEQLLTEAGEDIFTEGI